MAAFLDQGWPAFISADAVAAQYLPSVRERFADLELLVVDGDRYVGAGWAVPIVWDGSAGSLPEGYSDSLRRSVTEETAHTPNTLVVCAAQIDQAEQGRGIAADLLRAFREQAVARGLEYLIVPLRPTLKHRYPLTAIADYAAWIRADGAPFDPWLRTHWRMGARVLATAAQSQTMTGTIAEWEDWTGMTLPDAGDYIIPGGLAPLRIDDNGNGTYVEPNIWVQHPLDTPAH
ncbi:hypothetical protein D7I44_14595 [Gryllotalpicola protaetiae]|uniref:GNAT family N-acetyltransferase n=1 Tax=Gryllotalpicola protaetiae TaxID=2419771 RepID=A0A387BUD9_9MICO|nr:hypothetical protein D7I44_14595 [Gryllotalpicola protaetiae]